MAGAEGTVRMGKWLEGCSGSRRVPVDDENAAGSRQLDDSSLARERHRPVWMYRRQFRRRHHRNSSARRPQSVAIIEYIICVYIILPRLWYLYEGLYKWRDMCSWYLPDIWYRPLNKYPAGRLPVRRHWRPGFVLSVSDKFQSFCQSIMSDLS